MWTPMGQWSEWVKGWESEGEAFGQALKFWDTIKIDNTEGVWFVWKVEFILKKYGGERFNPQEDWVWESYALKKRRLDNTIVCEEHI